MKKSLSILFLVGIVIANSIVYNHVYHFTHFADAGVKSTAKPENLNWVQKAQLLFTGISNPRPKNDKQPQQVFETVVIERADGGKLYCWAMDAPQDSTMSDTSIAQATVILFHGYRSKKSDLLEEAKGFQQLGYHTLLVDFRGSGESSGNSTTVGYKEGEDVHAVVQYVAKKRPNQPIILFGQSMGAAAILKALTTKEMQELVQATVIESTFSSFLKTTKNRFTLMNVPSFPFAEILVFWGSIQHKFWGFGHNPTTYAEQINTPILMLHGAKDDRAYIVDAQVVFENLLSSSKQFVSFEGATHQPLIQYDEQLWLKEVNGFLSSVQP